MSNAHRGFTRTLLREVAWAIFYVLAGLLMGYILWGVKP